MRHAPYGAVLALFLVSCNNGSHHARPAAAGGNKTLPDPVATAAGAPTIAPVTQTIGAGGGSVTSSDGSLTLDIPAGALAADTDLTIQPITNTAWGGLGASYRLTPDGLKFATPVRLSLHLAPNLLASASPEALDIAFQNGAGFWFILKDGSYDTGTSTLTCTTSHFTDYTAIAEYQLLPTSASLGPTTSLDLRVNQCFYQTIAEDADAIAEVLTCSDSDEDALAPLIETSNWSVNGVLGGDTSVGKIAQLDGSSGKYTAPAAAPLANPVAASVQVRVRRGSAAYLVSNIKINSGFTGTITHDRTKGEKAVYTVDWTSEGALGGIETFTAEGSVQYTPFHDPDCVEVEFTPDHAPLGPQTYLLINRSVDPPTVKVLVEADWDVHECTQCRTDPVDCQDYHFFLGFDDGGTGTLSSDGNTVRGALLDLNSGENWSYEFTRGTPP